MSQTGTQTEGRHRQTQADRVLWFWPFVSDARPTPEQTSTELKEMIPVFEALTCFHVLFSNELQKDCRIVKFPTCRKDLIKKKHLVGKREKVFRNPSKFAGSFEASG